MTIPLNTLEYARKLREAGFTEEQAEGQARALLDAMSTTLVTNETLHALESRLDMRFASVDARFTSIEARFASIDARFEEQDRRLDTRLDELTARMDARLAELERRMTVRMLTGIAAVSALVKLL